MEIRAAERGNEKNDSWKMGNGKFGFALCLAT